MKVNKKWIGILLLAMLLLFAAGCTGQDDQKAETDASDTTVAAEEDATETDPTPAAESDTTGTETFIGNWSSGDVVLSIYMGKGTCYADVVWEDADRHDAWSMECTYDESSGKLVYENGVKTENVEDSTGNVEGEEVYQDGTGSFTYSDGTITWQDDKEQAGEGLAFKEI